MDELENDDVQLTKQNFRRVCRLCLHADDVLIDVLDGIDENPLKRPLAERVYDLYQIKVSYLDFYFEIRVSYFDNKTKKKCIFHFSSQKMTVYQPTYAIVVYTIPNNFRNFVLVCINVSVSFMILFNRWHVIQVKSPPERNGVWMIY